MLVDVHSNEEGDELSDIHREDRHNDGAFILAVQVLNDHLHRGDQVNVHCLLPQNFFQKLLAFCLEDPADPDSLNLDRVTLVSFRILLII
jgi:hypothetical protein